MSRTLLSLTLSAFFLAFAISAAAQPRLEEPRDTEPEAVQLRVFLDCGACDFNYLREQIPYVSYVRDPDQSDVHVLVTSNATGGNARTHVLDFIGRGRFAEEKHSLEFTEAADATGEDRRLGLGKKLELGLIPYWIETGMADRMDVSVRQEQKVGDPAREYDPWNNWVFGIAAGGAFNKESSRGSFNLWGNVEANRVTEEWRLRNEGYIRYEEQVFKQEGEGDIVSKQQRKYLESAAIKSLGNHWAAGLFGGLRQSNYENLDLGAYLAPAVEYSIFPYSEVNRREVTIAYKLRYLHRNYEELTIFEKMQENLWNHSVELAARIRQPWGSLFAGIEGSHFFDDFNMNRLEMDTYLNLRVTSGLSLQLGGDMALINDQRSLPAGETSLEDLLLSQRQLATNYRFSGSVGLRYTFGSIYNDVVNTRL